MNSIIRPLAALLVLTAAPAFAAKRTAVRPDDNAREAGNLKTIYPEHLSKSDRRERAFLRLDHETFPP